MRERYLILPSRVPSRGVFASGIPIFTILCRLALIAVLGAVPSRLGALDIALGSAAPTSFSLADLASRSRPYASGRSVSLGELCPLVDEVWKIEAVSVSERRVWESGELGERLFEIRLVESADGWDLVFGKESLRAVTRIVLSGEALSEKAIEAWVSWEGVPELKAEAARFSANHAVSVRMSDVPNTQTKLLAVARAGGKLPDVVMIQSDYAPGLAAARVIQSVEYLRTADLVPKGFDAFRHAGKFWAVPFYFDAQLVFYNKKLTGGFLPDTWTTDDLERIAAKLLAAERGRSVGETGLKAPMSWNVYSAYWLLPFMAGFGKSSILEPDGSMIIDDAPTAAALSWLLDLAGRGLLEPAERDAMISWFASGRTAFILSGSYSIPEFSKIGIDFGVAPYPILSATGKPLAPLLDFKGFAIGRRTSSPVLARRFVQYMTSPGVQAAFSAKLSKLPASMGAMEASKSANRYYSQLRRSYEVGLVVPPAEAYSAFKNVMWKLLRFLFTGQMDVATTLGTARKLMAENLE